MAASSLTISVLLHVVEGIICQTLNLLPNFKPRGPGYEFVYYGETHKVRKRKLRFTKSSTLVFVGPSILNEI